MANKISATEADSPGWWLEKLGQKLYADREHLHLLDRYYRGNPRLPEGSGVSTAYQRWQRKARTNFAEMVIEAMVPRMQVTGFRTGAEGDDNGDKAARRIWDANDLDVEAAEVHRMQLTMGRAYTIVGTDPDEDEPIVTGEDPRQVTTEQDPRIARRTLAGLKVYRDEPQKTDYAFLYLPGEVWTAAKSASKLGGDSSSRFRASAWEWTGFQELAVPVVPVVRFANSRGAGEFEPHLDLLDRINSMVLQRMVIAVMQAFRQRAIEGELPPTDDAGNPINYDDVFEAGPDALWQLPPDVKIWESAQVDLSPILQATKSDVLDLAAVTQTPMHYFNPESTNGSAEGAALAREGLVFKTEDRIKRSTIGWRGTMSLAFLLKGDEQRAKLSAMQPLWRSPERRTLAERADAASKATDIPWRQKMIEIWQFDPEVVDRMEQDRAADAFLQAALAVAATPPQQAPAGQPAPNRPARPGP